MMNDLEQLTKRAENHGFSLIFDGAKYVLCDQEKELLGAGHGFYEIEMFLKGYEFGRGTDHEYDTKDCEHE